MTLILSGTNGLSDVDGDASTPAIRGTDANTGMFFGTDIVGLSTGGSERMRIDSSGNVGIGTSSPSAKLDVNGSITLGGNYINIASPNGLSGDWVGGYNINYSSGVKNVATGASNGIYQGNSGFIAFHTNTSQTAGTTVPERMRITSAGNVGIGTSSPSYRLVSLGGRIQVGSGTTAQEGIAIQRITGYATITGINHNNDAYNGLAFYTGASEAMRIDTSGNLLVGATGTANGKVHINGSVVYSVPATFSGSIGSNADWATGFGAQAINLSLWASSGIGGVSVYNVSDRRLKKDIQTLTGKQALSFVSVAKPVQFVWKDNNTTDTGFIAQDVLAAGFGHLVSMVPDAAVEKEVDENGNESPAGSRFVMKYDSVIPILTAAIQELKAELDTVKAELATLKGN
jgi:hypothetical protein